MTCIYDRRAAQASAVPKTKVFKDPIHIIIELPELCVKIIDTRQFQRLRHIKQLGGCYYVFPGASHNRFEHSIGVCHLAGQLVRTLSQKQKELDINERDILCVEIGALCHDLGHGPFSHMFDEMFILEVTRNPWKHEQGSVDMFEHLLEENPHIKRELSEREITFIKEIIYRDKSQPCKGSDKTFLYEIVNNDTTGIDVDKWDYLARDSLYLGIIKGFDHTRFMKFVRVVEVEEEDGRRIKHICARDKEASALYDMFHTRYMLHSCAYQHKVTMIVQIMFKDALVLANEHLRFQTKDAVDHRRRGVNEVDLRKTLPLSETIHCMHTYTRVTDHVFQQILYSEDENLKESRALLERIDRRELYQRLGKVLPEEKEIFEIKMMEQYEKHKLQQKDIKSFEVRMDYGRKEKDPLQSAWFWEKENPNKGVKLKREEVSSILPMKFQDTFVHFYCTDQNQEAQIVAKQIIEELKKRRTPQE